MEENKIMSKIETKKEKEEKIVPDTKYTINTDTDSEITLSTAAPAIKSENKNIIDFFSNKKEKANVSVAPVDSQSKATYMPNKKDYNPIDDACWSKNEPVPYKALAQTLYCMEETTKRLELLAIVCNYFRSIIALTPKDLVPSIYILTNKVAPDYESIELGIGDTILFKALGEATGCTVAKLKTEFQSKGDIGLVAEVTIIQYLVIYDKITLQLNILFF
jgi:DNA ligase 1